MAERLESMAYTPAGLRALAENLEGVIRGLKERERGPPEMVLVEWNVPPGGGWRQVRVSCTAEGAADNLAESRLFRSLIEELEGVHEDESVEVELKWTVVEWVE